MVRFLFCILFIFLGSCGKHDFPNYEDNGLDQIQLEESNETYRSTIFALNGSRFKGQALLWIRGNQFYIRVTAENAEPEVRYSQYIHTVDKCPTDTGDRNQDRVVDALELRDISGDMVMPLDEELLINRNGSNSFPISTEKGKYYYSRSISYENLLKNLWRNDSSMEGVIGLPRGKEFEPSERSIVIYGTRTNQLLPVGCGTFQITTDEF